MPLYELTKDSINPVRTIRFADAGLKERGDLQRVLRERIDVVAPGVLIVAEEFGQWEESRRRIDLLGVDANANLVVIELKRTEDGGHMELQAIRYAAMISTLTFERVVELFTEHLSRLGQSGDPRQLVLDHLGWDSADDGEFAASVRIVLASADFGKELMTAVLWLNEQGLDIRCVRLIPYQLNERLLVDVQQVVPLPEASEYTVQIRAKQQEARSLRANQQRDFTKFVLTLGGALTEPMNKRRSIFEVVRFLVKQGVSPEEIQAVLGERRRFRRAEGHLDVSQAINWISAHLEEGDPFAPRYYFNGPDEILHFRGNTYIFNKMWASETEDTLKKLAAAFPQHPFSVEAAGCVIQQPLPVTKLS